MILAQISGVLTFVAFYVTDFSVYVLDNLFAFKSKLVCLAYVKAFLNVFIEGVIGLYCNPMISVKFDPKLPANSCFTQKNVLCQNDLKLLLWDQTLGILIV